MKKLLLVLVLMIVPVMCCYEDDGKETIEIGNIYNYDFEGSDKIPEFVSIIDAINYINVRTKYKEDIDVYGIDDYWQTPEETFNLKTGDCEDQTIFLQYVLDKQFNLDSYLLFMQYPDSSHVIVEIDSVLYDVLSARQDYLYEHVENEKILHSVPYSEVIWMAVNYHDNVGKYE